MREKDKSDGTTLSTVRRLILDYRTSGLHNAVRRMNAIRRRRRESWGVPEELRLYVANGDIRASDVLMGRGGSANSHAGNQAFHALKRTLQERYQAADRAEKTAISQELVELVTATGGRFLQLEMASLRWYVASASRARIKASQALREVDRNRRGHPVDALHQMPSIVQARPRQVANAEADNLFRYLFEAATRNFLNEVETQADWYEPEVQPVTVANPYMAEMGVWCSDVGILLDNTPHDHYQATNIDLTAVWNAMASRRFVN